MKHDDRTHDIATSADHPQAEATFVSLAAPLVDEALEHAASIHHDPAPETLHQLRVALRRLRSLWWAYRPLLDKAENTRQRALYRYLADAAGRTRDWDILLELLATDRAGVDAVPVSLRDAREAALATSRETLINADIKTLLHDALASTAKELNTAPERHALRGFARKRVRAAEKSLRRRMRTASRAKLSDYDAFHEVRKAGKKVRYLVEFFEPLLDADQDRTLKRLKKIQQRFGELNDVIASEALLREHIDLLAETGESDDALQFLKKQRKRRLRAAAGLLRKR
jgi:CHAD domain-containing protein